MVKRSNWTRLREDGDEAVEAATAELLRQGSNVSVYECASAADRQLVAVALSATRQSRQAFQYIEISSSDLGGIRVSRSDGATPLPRANRLHRDLDLVGDRGRLLVERLAQRRAPIEEIRAEHLRKLAAQLLAGGHPVPPESWLLR